VGWGGVGCACRPRVLGGGSGGGVAWRGKEAGLRIFCRCQTAMHALCMHGRLLYRHHWSKLHADHRTKPLTCACCCCCMLAAAIQGIRRPAPH
jgi:hypothetical protein